MRSRSEPVGFKAINPAKAWRMSPRMLAISAAIHAGLLIAFFQFMPSLAPKRIQPVLRSFELSMTPAPKQSGTARPQRPAGPSAAEPDASIPVQTTPVAGPEVSSNLAETGAPSPVESQSVPVAGADAGSAPVQDTQPRQRTAVKPAYPARAEEYGVHGKVIVLFLVNEKGNVTRVKVVKETPRGYGFGAEALKAVRRYSFDPSLKNGRPVEAWVEQEIVFQQ